jgi:Flp pilus assembly pilin Flp
MLAIVHEFAGRDDGQDLVEYAMLAGLIALVAFAAVAQVGNTINTVFWQAIAKSA